VEWSVQDAVAAADEGRAIYRPEVHHATSFLYGNHDPGVCALALQALAFALQGQSVRAVTQMREAISRSEALGHAATLAQPLTQLPWALQINGDAEAALRESERALALEDEVVHPQFFGIAHAMRGWALSCIGREEEGVAELERALSDELQASDIWAAMIGALLAEALLRQGRRGAARDVLDTAREDRSRALAVRSALALARSPSAGHDAALRLLGDLCHRLPPENDTDYGREARTLLSEGVATTMP